MEAAHNEPPYLDLYCMPSLSLYLPKADDKIFVCKFSKNVKSKLYHIEKSKTIGRTV